MSGKSMLDQVTQATGLPEELMKSELYDLIIEAGFKPETITLDELRVVMTNYLQDVILQAKKEYS